MAIGIEYLISDNPKFRNIAFWMLETIEGVDKLSVVHRDGFFEVVMENKGRSFLKYFDGSIVQTDGKTATKRVERWWVGITKDIGLHDTYVCFNGRKVIRCSANGYFTDVKLSLDFLLGCGFRFVKEEQVLATRRFFPYFYDVTHGNRDSKDAFLRVDGNDKIYLYQKDGTKVDFKHSLDRVMIELIAEGTWIRVDEKTANTLIQNKQNEQKYPKFYKHSQCIWKGRGYIIRISDTHWTDIHDRLCKWDEDRQSDVDNGRWIEIPDPTTKEKTIGWQHIFNSTLKLHNNIGTAFRIARENGYPYICWSGVVYTTDAAEKTIGTLEELGLKL